MVSKKKSKLQKQESIVNTLLVRKRTSRNDLNPAIASLRIMIIYLVMGILWILFSDKVLNLLVDDPAVILEIQLYKGWFYVVVTAVIFYFIVKSKIDLFKITIDKMEDSYVSLDQTYTKLKDIDLKLRNQFEVTEQTKQALEVSDQRYELAVEGSNDGIWDWDITTGSYFISNAWKKELGYSEETESTFNSWNAKIHPDDIMNVQKQINTYLIRREGIYESTFRVQKADQSYVWVLSKGKAVWDKNGTPLRMAGSHTDITHQKNLEEKLYNLAYYDVLTGLPNMSMLKLSVELFLESFKEQQKFALVLFDIDNFKNINDVKGHSTGDEVLKSIGELFKNQLVNPDFVARTGGDEFALVLFPSHKYATLEERVTKIIASVQKSWVFEEQEFFISFSAGIAIYPDHGTDYQTLLQNADTAMYTSKANGKDQISFYDVSMRKKTVEFIQMESMLRNAIENDEFQIYFQPQVSLKSDKIVGVEALIRWKHAERGFISPLEFIPFAEQTGMIHKITFIVFDKVFAQLTEWRKKGFDKLTVSINLSSKLLTNMTIIEDLMVYMKKHNVSGKDFEIEITETALVEDIEDAKEVLNALKELEVKIALDDFGTGYSSINYLQTLPIDFLKIDRSLIMSVLERERKILKSLIELSHALNLKVVAEGVETIEQLNVLRKLGCDFVQGYLLYRPQPADEVEIALVNQAEYIKDQN